MYVRVCTCGVCSVDPMIENMVKIVTDIRVAGCLTQNEDTPFSPSCTPGRTMVHEKIF